MELKPPAICSHCYCPSLDLYHLTCAFEREKATFSTVHYVICIALDSKVITLEISYHFICFVIVKLKPVYALIHYLDNGDNSNNNHIIG